LCCYFFLTKAQEESDEDEVYVEVILTVFMEDFCNHVFLKIYYINKYLVKITIFFQVEDIKSNIENIQKYVNALKRLHSIILDAPNTDDSLFICLKTL
jgi:hypothetical protein